MKSRPIREKGGDWWKSQSHPPLMVGRSLQKSRPLREKGLDSRESHPPLRSGPALLESRPLGAQGRVLLESRPPLRSGRTVSRPLREKGLDSRESHPPLRSGPALVESKSPTLRGRSLSHPPIATDRQVLESHRTTVRGRPDPHPPVATVRPLLTSHRPIARGRSPVLVPSPVSPSSRGSGLPVDTNLDNAVPYFPDENFPYHNRNDFDLPPPDRSKKVKAAVRRNAFRLELRNKQDQNLLSKSHLPKNLSDLFGPVFVGPDDEKFDPQPWLLESISRVAGTTTPAPAPPPFLFATDDLSVNHNTDLLRANDYDLTKIIDANQHTTLCYGSEFRSIEDMESIYGEHELFGFFTEIHQEGMEYHFDRDLTESERVEEVQANLLRGNHNSAKDRPKELETKITREVTYGFALPIWLASLAKIPKALLQACGLVTQSTLTESGERKEKSRLTHDLSFSITSPYAAVNRRLDRERYPELIFGFCLLRIIHFIIALRLLFPETPILISKYDFSDAYRRMSHRATSAVQTIIALGKIASPKPQNPEYLNEY